MCPVSISGRTTKKEFKVGLNPHTQHRRTSRVNATYNLLRITYNLQPTTVVRGVVFSMVDGGTKTRPSSSFLWRIDIP